MVDGASPFELTKWYFNLKEIGTSDQIDGHNAVSKTNGLTFSLLFPLEIYERRRLLVELNRRVEQFKQIQTDLSTQNPASAIEFLEAESKKLKVRQWEFDLCPLICVVPYFGRRFIDNLLVRSEVKPQVDELIDQLRNSYR